MFQPNDQLPSVPRHPSPWSLTGSAWIVAMRLPAGSPARTAFIPQPVASEARSPIALLMCVDYATSACGPYRELLFIPGTLPFEDGRRHFTISRIVVSTWDSVVNGRANWGIPKDRADFEIAVSGPQGRDAHIRVVSDDGHELCSLRFGPKSFAPRLPVPGGLVPRRLRTLAQRFDGRTFYYAPATSGWVRPVRLVDWSVDRERFADLRDSRIVAAMRVEDFRMTFPVACIANRE